MSESLNPSNPFADFINSIEQMKVEESEVKGTISEWVEEVVPTNWGITSELQLQVPLRPIGLKQKDPTERLRPKSLEEIIGQDHVKETLTRFMDAAKKRNKPLAHTLLYGPPGLGKTTFASVISTYMGHNLRLLSGPNVDKRVVMDLITELVGSSEGQTFVVFIDEIHGVDKDAMTLLLPLMEDFEFEDLELPPFTVVGATTEPSKLLGPLRDRFELRYQLEFYTRKELSLILRRSLSIIMGIDIEEVNAFCDPSNPLLPGTQAIKMLAIRSRGVPRTANHLIKRVVDYMETANHEVDWESGVEGPNLSPTQTSTLLHFHPTIVRETMVALDIDENGLEKKDRAMLVAMLIRYNLRPVGIRALASVLGENPETVEYVMEPHLIRAGLINREQRGRTLTIEGQLIAALESEGKTRF